jgi:2-polyprenyl-3-methyl-5-hydroxy-6-metoxy-1,4-benzoquinol methylase
LVNANGLECDVSAVPKKCVIHPSGNLKIMKSITNPDDLKGNLFKPNQADFSNEIAYDDHKIKFACKYARGKSVLDIGCVEHNPENYKSKYWLHKALKEVASSLVGMDLYAPGVKYLNEVGYNIICADSQQFDLNQSFDVLIAGDIIEHLEDFHGFLTSCKRHMHADSRLIISTPNPWYWRNVVKASLSPEVNNNPEHTCWLCPRTLRQLLSRHNLAIGEIAFGSRYMRDRLMPLPSGLKHTSFHAEVYLA